MKLNREERSLLSEAVLNLAFSEAQKNRDNKFKTLLALDKRLHNYFLSLLTEEEFKNELL